MRKPFNGDFALTQYFNDERYRASYAKFKVQDHNGNWVPLPGHNGVDYGLPSGTPVVAPHNGKVIEALDDPLGYGWYIKIENDQEGSVLAHLTEGSIIVKVGESVDEGQKIALSDNSGNTTGPHLHWGYYRKPRDRQNGFGGFEDQLPFLQQAMNEQPQVPAGPSVTITDTDELRGLALIVNYRQSRKAGPDANFESFVRTICTNDDHYPVLALENESQADQLKILSEQNKILTDQLREKTENPVFTPPVASQPSLPTPDHSPTPLADPIKVFIEATLAKIVQLFGRKNDNN